MEPAAGVSLPGVRASGEPDEPDEMGWRGAAGLRGRRRRWPGRAAALRAVCLGLRLVVGALLALAALGKALDVPGFRDVLRTYDLFPAWSLPVIAVLQPLLEGVIAAALLGGGGPRSGQRLRAAGAASAALHGTFAVLLTVELLRGIQLPNCGCFGVFHARPLRWYTPLEDLLMVALSLGIVVTAHWAAGGGSRGWLRGRLPGRGIPRKGASRWTR